MICRSASRLIAAAALLASALALAPAAPAAPGGCSRTKGFAEREICTDPQAADHERTLKRVLGAVLDAIKVPKFRAAYEAQQKRWETKVRDACRTRECLYRAYDVRLDDLNRQAHEDGFVH